MAAIRPKIGRLVSGIWIRTAVRVERLGQPALCAVLFGMLSVPLSRLRAFQGFYEAHFVGGVPEWYEVATGVFLSVLIIGLLVQRLCRRSWWGLRRSARILDKLVRYEWVDDASRGIALRWLFAYVIMHHLGDDPKQLSDIKELLKKGSSFQRLLDELKKL